MLEIWNIHLCFLPNLIPRKDEFLPLQNLFIYSRSTFTKV